MNHAKPSLVRFSLRTLLVLMMLLCIALATTISASPRVEYAMKWVSALAPAVAILLAAATSGTRRAFWIGFAAFGIWLQVQLLRNSDAGDYLSARFASVFREQFRDQLCELHLDRIELLRLRFLQNSWKEIFFAEPDIKVEEIKDRFPRPYNTCTAWARDMVVNTSGAIAWQWLRLTASIMGGFAVAVIYASRQHARGKQLEVAAKNPAAG